MVQEGASSATGAGAAGTAMQLVPGPAQGLVNLGNTCFFNSSLQLLLACPHLSAAAAAAARRPPAPADEALCTKGPLGFALQQAVLNLNGAHLGRGWGGCRARQAPHMHGHGHACGMAQLQAASAWWYGTRAGGRADPHDDPPVCCVACMVEAGCMTLSRPEQAAALCTRCCFSTSAIRPQSQQPRPCTISVTLLRLPLPTPPPYCLSTYLLLRCMYMPYSASLAAGFQGRLQPSGHAGGGAASCPAVQGGPAHGRGHVQIMA